MVHEAATPIIAQLQFSIVIQSRFGSSAFIVRRRGATALRLCAPVLRAMQKLKTAVNDYISIFHVPQMARIRSKWLRVPEVVVTVILFFAVVAYRYLYKLGFMTILQPETMVWMGPAEVQSNFFSCFRAFGNCTPIEPNLTAPDHCAQSGHPDAKFPCRLFAKVQAGSRSAPSCPTCLATPSPASTTSLQGWRNSTW